MRSLEEIALERSADSGRVHVLVQLHNPLTPDVRRRLEAGGVRLHDAVSRTAFFASMDLTGRVAEAGKTRDPLSLGMWGVRAIIAPEPDDKLSSELREGTVPGWAQVDVNGQAGAAVVVSYYSDAEATKAMTSLKKLGASAIENSDYFERITARVPLDQLRRAAKLDWVRYIEAIAPPPRADNNSVSASLLGVPEVQADPFYLSGNGVKVAVIDSGRIGDHPDLEGRVTLVDSGAVSLHATHVAGTIAATGASDLRLKGMAPQAQLLSFTYFGDIALKMLSSKREYGASVVSNSWGNIVGETSGNCNSFGGYGSNERDIDRLVRREGMSIVFAMGNERDDDGCSIRPRGGFLTTGRPASAKNIISVAAIDGQKTMTEFSDYGPTQDGRLKPDISALGLSVRSTYPGGGSTVMSGTSMSTPAISGTLALLVEKYRQVNGGDSPDAALLKSVLLNTAVDLGNPGPDYTFGYGLANAVEAVRAIDGRQYGGDTILARTITHAIEVPPGGGALRVMLTYSDTEAASGAATALVNNLDLQLTAPDGTLYLPLTLDPANPTADARPTANSRDPVEQVVVPNPMAGTWTAEIRPTSMVNATQPYFVTWSFAPVTVPDCTTTIIPSIFNFGAKETSDNLAVTRSNQCAPWTAESEDGWLNVRYASSSSGSGIIKLYATANDTGSTRRTGVRAAEQRLTVTQTTSCLDTPLAEGTALVDALTSADCMQEFGNYAKLYSFEARAGQFVAVQMQSRVFDTYLELRSADGTLIAGDDDGFGGTDSRIPPDRGGVYLPFSGRYIIVATS